ncbi:hypothetical protein FQN54_008711 [Arachnomyces sp. PD_36]|nr:hypothetical protein FQN54_008711 [Arachnomyces sp. PD_36]
MSSTIPRLSVLLTFAVSALVSPVLGQFDAPETLRPLSMSDFASGPEKRVFDQTQLDPRDADTFLWGNPIEDSNEFTFANMTVFSVGNERIVSMERFKPMLKSVECGEKTVLEFESKEDFEYATRAWGWVNEDETHNFILVADHPGCGPDDERQPFYIHDADYDEEKNTAFLYGAEKEWKEVARTFDLDFGRMTWENPNAPTDLSKRWGEWGFTKGLELDMSSDFSGNIYSQSSSVLDFSVDCVGCGTSGAVEVTGRVTVDILEPEEVSLTITPRGLRADMGIKVHAKTGTNPFTISYSKAVLQIPLPWSISLPKIGTIGFVFKEKIGISTKGNQAETDFEFGMGASISDEAMLRVDLANSDNNEFSGWTPDFESKPFSISGDAKSDFTVYGQTSLGAELSIFDWGWEAVVALKIPELTATIDTHPTSGSACEEAGQEGISVDTRIGGTLALKAGKRGDLAITLPINTQPLIGRAEGEPEWDDFDWDALDRQRDERRTIDGFAAPANIPVVDLIERETDSELESRQLGVGVEYKIWSHAWDLWSKCFPGDGGSTSPTGSSSSVPTPTSTPSNTPLPPTSSSSYVPPASSYVPPTEPSNTPGPSYPPEPSYPPQPTEEPEPEPTYPDPTYPTDTTSATPSPSVLARRRNVVRRPF